MIEGAERRLDLKKIYSSNEYYPGKRTHAPNPLHFFKDISVQKGRVVASKEYIKRTMNTFRKQFNDTDFVVVEM